MAYPLSKTAKQIIALLASLAIALGVAAAGAWITAQTVGTWYQTLAKPAWTPPDWLFGPVWTTLYVLMAVAAWLVWNSGDTRQTRLPLGLYALQLALNLAWSYIFFGLRSPGLAAAEIGILWIAILATLFAFSRHALIAGLLLVPYLAWVSFASFLNVAIWRLNA
jgi:tryptophan-rich sensory protein